jgi:hypothetical protein
MKKFILTDKNNERHVVCRVAQFYEGDYVMAVDGTSICRLDRSSVGNIGEQVGGMFFKYDFDAFPGRYVKVVHSESEKFPLTRIVITEKTLPKCPKAYTVIFNANF